MTGNFSFTYFFLCRDEDGKGEEGKGGRGGERGVTDSNWCNRRLQFRSRPNNCPPIPVLKMERMKAYVNG